MSIPDKLVNASADQIAPFVPEIEFQNIGIRARESWSSIQAFHECFSVTSLSLGSVLVPYLDRSVRATMGEAFPPISNQLNQEILKRMAAGKEALARSVIDAATVVIIQAILDSAVNQYLVLLAQVDPAMWESDLRKETVCLSELADESYHTILTKRSLAFARSLSSKSLPKKVQLVLDHCRHGSIAPSPTDFRFDIPRLKLFDDTRHDVAHGRAIGFTISNMDELFLFLWQTLRSLEAVIGAHLSFQRNPMREIDTAKEPQLRNLII